MFGIIFGKPNLIEIDLIEPSEFDKIIEPLRKKLRSGKMPVVRCPKFHCGCGLCAPKALHEKDAKEIFEQRTKHLEPQFRKDIGGLDSKETLYHRFKQLDIIEKDSKNNEK